MTDKEIDRLEEYRQQLNLARMDATEALEGQIQAERELAILATIVKNARLTGAELQGDLSDFEYVLLALGVAAGKNQKIT